MKTQLQKRLATTAPSIRIGTIWEPDPDCERGFRELQKPGNCFEGEDRDDWTCWQSEVEATTIVNGELVSGSAYLGGTWEKYGDNPAESNPEISGYEEEMTTEALGELLKAASKAGANETQLDAIQHAINSV
jgi:hypothetical protein